MTESKDRMPGSKGNQPTTPEMTRDSQHAQILRNRHTRKHHKICLFLKTFENITGKGVPTFHGDAVLESVSSCLGERQTLGSHAEQNNSASPPPIHGWGSLEPSARVAFPWDQKLTAAQSTPQGSLREGKPINRRGKFLVFYEVDKNEENEEI